MKKIILIYIYLFCTLGHAQSLGPEAVSSSGNFAQILPGSISWTLGEPVSDSYVNSFILTKGFHQPRVILLNAVKDVNAGGGIYVYPNPVVNELLIDFSQMKYGTYSITLYDELGKELQDFSLRVTALDQNKRIDMLAFADGIYLVKINNRQTGQTKMFKITKQN